MGLLTTKLGEQRYRGVLLNQEVIDSLPLNQLVERIKSDDLLAYQYDKICNPNNHRIMVTKFMPTTQAYCFDAGGTLQLDYQHLLLAYWAIILQTNYDPLERRVVESLARFIGAAQLRAGIQQLCRSSKQGIIFPRFTSGEGEICYNNVDIATSHIMGLLTKPANSKYTSYICDWDNKPYEYFFHDVLHKNTKHSQEYANTNKSLWVNNCFVNIELRLAPGILKGDFGNLTDFYKKVLTAYQSGQLLFREKGTVGRKPRVEFMFSEKMYPSLEEYLSKKLERFHQICDDNKLTPEDAGIYYLSPYFFCYYASNKCRSLFKGLCATTVQDFNDTRFLRGVFV